MISNYHIFMAEEVAMPPKWATLNLITFSGDHDVITFSRLPPVNLVKRYLHTKASYIIGKFFTGRFKSKHTGKTYDENSMSVEIIGVTPEHLQDIASEIAKEFNQESVLVREHDTNRIYLVER